VSDAPDPLGKRALFWAPAERDEEGPRYPDGGGVPGRHALFSDVGSATTPAGPARPRHSGPGRWGTGRAGHPSGRRPASTGRGTAVSDAGYAEAAHAGRGAVLPDDLERPVGSGMFGILTLHCSSCRVRSQVDLVEYVVLHLPLWFWRPGRGYTRFMSCPACRRRTWISASWTSWSR
jgi:hypothetical protein